MGDKHVVYHQKVAALPIKQRETFPGYRANRIQIRQRDRCAVCKRGVLGKLFLQALIDREHRFVNGRGQRGWMELVRLVEPNLFAGDRMKCRGWPHI